MELAAQRGAMVAGTSTPRLSCTPLTIVRPARLPKMAVGKARVSIIGGGPYSGRFSVVRGAKGNEQGSNGVKSTKVEVDELERSTSEDSGNEKDANDHGPSTSGSPDDSSSNRDDQSSRGEGPAWRKLAAKIVNTAVGVLASVARSMGKVVPQPVAAVLLRLLRFVRPLLPVLAFAVFFFISNSRRTSGPR